MDEMQFGFWCHNEAISIEHSMSKVFGCNRFGVGGIVNSDFIERNPFIAMLSTLTYLYNINTDDIDKFIEDYIYYCHKSIKEIIAEESIEYFETMKERWENITK